MGHFRGVSYLLEGWSHFWGSVEDKWVSYEGNRTQRSSGELVYLRICPSKCPQVCRNSYDRGTRRMSPGRRLCSEHQELCQPLELKNIPVLVCSGCHDKKYYRLHGLNCRAVFAHRSGVPDQMPVDLVSNLVSLWQRANSSLGSHMVLRFSKGTEWIK